MTWYRGTNTSTTGTLGSVLAYASSVTTAISTGYTLGNITVHVDPACPPDGIYFFGGTSNLSWDNLTGTWEDWGRLRPADLDGSQRIADAIAAAFSPKKKE